VFGEEDRRRRRGRGQWEGAQIAGRGRATATHRTVSRAMDLRSVCTHLQTPPPPSLSRTRTQPPTVARQGQQRHASAHQGMTTARCTRSSAPVQHACGDARISTYTPARTSTHPKHCETYKQPSSTAKFGLQRSTPLRHCMPTARARPARRRRHAAAPCTLRPRRALHALPCAACLRLHTLIHLVRALQEHWRAVPQGQAVHELDQAAPDSLVLVARLHECQAS
jgi:hypothetical protein